MFPESNDFKIYQSTDHSNQGNRNKVMQNTIEPFSDLLDLVCTLQHSISIYLKIMSISKKQNKLTSLFIPNILFIRLQITDSKSGGSGYAIMNRQDGRA